MNHVAAEVRFGSRERAVTAQRESFETRRRLNRRAYPAELEARVAGEEPRYHDSDCHRDDDANYGKDCILGAV